MYIAESATIPSDEFKFNSILHFMNYSNTTTNKTVLIRTNNALPLMLRLLLDYIAALLQLRNPNNCQY
jgi:hypothetical protein